LFLSRNSRWRASTGENSSRIVPVIVHSFWNGGRSFEEAGRWRRRSFDKP
jgi:hypothetical protein